VSTRQSLPERHGEPATTLSARIASDLRLRIESGEWSAGERMPGEHQLARRYDVSRATIRTALQDLESRGLTLTKHGLGTIVTAHEASDRADLRRLESMTDTIRGQGRTPGAEYRSISIRAADPTEIVRLRLTDGDEVLATERAITADGATVAFSYDVIPRSILEAGFDAREITGSLFALLERHGVTAVVAVTELHAAHGSHIGWGERPEDPVYLLLVQVHSDARGRPVALASTYFLEGRFPFGLVRHR